MKSKIDMEKAKANLKAYARKEISKRELVQFRIDAGSLEALLVEADKRKQPLGTMIRDWVLEKLAECKHSQLSAQATVPEAATLRWRQAWKSALSKPEIQDTIIEALIQPAAMVADQLDYFQSKEDRSSSASVRPSKTIQKSEKGKRQQA